MKTKNVPLLLAPMAGFGDRAFREICAEFEPDRFFSEMVSAKAIHFGDKKTRLLCERGEAARPLSVQLFGHEKEILAEACRWVIENFHPEGIDLNFGCPVPKIVRGGDGSALMRDPALCYEIVSSVREAAGELPLSVKIRAGWEEESLNAPEIASLCEKAGVDFITVHGRTRAELYRAGCVRHDLIRLVKKSVSIPVFANGDIVDGESAKKMLRDTGCDGLMIGRGAIGKPWIFSEIRAALNGTKPPRIDVKEVIKKHLSLAFLYKPNCAAQEMRAHFAHYLRGFRGAAALRDRASHAESLADYLAILEELDEIE